MGFSFLTDVIEKQGNFPTDADPSSFLVAVQLALTDVMPFHKKIPTLPHPITLCKYTDNPGFYQIDYCSLPKGVHVSANPLPFIATNDNEAIQKLEQEMANYNAKYTRPIFRFGRMRDVAFSPYAEDRDIYRRMADKPTQARRILNNSVSMTSGPYF